MSHLLQIKSVHHIAIICSDYSKSKGFYTDILGFKILKETYREERRSMKLDLSLGGNYVIELFSFPNPPQRMTRPEACGLRHLAFAVDNLEESIEFLASKGVHVEKPRMDELTGKRYAFFQDPDGLPLELYEA